MAYSDVFDEAYDERDRREQARERARARRTVFGGDAETWLTREGLSVRVVDMLDSHLANTVRFVLRAAETSVGYRKITGDARREAVLAWLKANVLCWAVMLAEARRRGFDLGPFLQPDLNEPISLRSSKPDHEPSIEPRPLGGDEIQSIRFSNLELD